MKNLVLIQRNPELEKDISLFKLILMPLELFVLKCFLNDLRPINIREVYTHAIFIIFHFVFCPEELEKRPNFFQNDLINAGYGCVLVGAKEKKKILSEYSKKIEKVSETKIRQEQYDYLHKVNSRVPSYERIQNVFKKFEEVGIIYKRGLEGKGIIYALNPEFYKIFKDKIPQILRL